MMTLRSRSQRIRVYFQFILTILQFVGGVQSLSG